MRCHLNFNKPCIFHLLNQLTPRDCHLLLFYREGISEGQDDKRRWSEQIGCLRAKDEAFEGTHLYDPIKAAEMCLVANMVIPKTFKVLEFVKYTRT